MAVMRPPRSPAIALEKIHRLKSRLHEQEICTECDTHFNTGRCHKHVKRFRIFMPACNKKAISAGIDTGIINTVDQQHPPRVNLCSPENLLQFREMQLQIRQPVINDDNLATLCNLVRDRFCVQPDQIRQAFAITQRETHITMNRSALVCQFLVKFGNLIFSHIQSLQNRCDIQRRGRQKTDFCPARMFCCQFRKKSGQTKPSWRYGMKLVKNNMLKRVQHFKHAHIGLAFFRPVSKQQITHDFRDSDNHLSALPCRIQIINLPDPSRGDIDFTCFLEPFCFI